MIPAPPAAFWATVPWEAYVGILFLVLFALPFYYARARGRLDDFNVLARGQAALNIERTAFVTELQTAYRQVQAELQTARADRDVGWDLARGQEILAHTMWHEATNAQMHANALLALMQRSIDGRVLSETMRELLLQYQPYKPMPALLPLRDGPRKKAHETRYGGEAKP